MKQAFIEKPTAESAAHTDYSGSSRKCPKF